jgi:hypothetical protein
MGDEGQPRNIRKPALASPVGARLEWPAPRLRLRITPQLGFQPLGEFRSSKRATAVGWLAKRHGVGKSKSSRRQKLLPFASRVERVAAGKFAGSE